MTSRTKTGFRMIFGPSFFAVLLALIVFVGVIYPAARMITHAADKMRAPFAVRIDNCQPAGPIH